MSSVIAEQTIQDHFENLLQNSTDFEFGLVIGYEFESRYTFISVVPTPEEPRENKEDLNSFDSLSDEWIIQHYQQIQRMLVGGISIVGFYSVSSSKDIKQRIPRIYQLIAESRGIDKTKRNENKFIKQLSSKNVRKSENFLLHYCPETKKHMCQLFHENLQEEAKRVEVKYNKNAVANTVSQIDSSLKLSFDVPLLHAIQKPPTQRALKKQLESVIQFISEQIVSSIPVINGKVVESKSNSSSLGVDPFSSKSNSLTQDTLISTQGNKIEVELFSKVPLTFSTASSFSNKHIKELNNGMKCSGNILFSGQITSRAFVNKKHSLQNAILAVKEDLLESLVHRFELLTEELESQYTQLSPQEKNDFFNVFDEKNTNVRLSNSFSGSWTFPKRVFVYLGSSHNVTLCDYVFPFESQEEVEERCIAMLSPENLRSSKSKKSQTTSPSDAFDFQTENFTENASVELIKVKSSEKNANQTKKRKTGKSNEGQNQKSTKGAHSQSEITKTTGMIDRKSVV